jgi:hypothetical protein
MKKNMLVLFLLVIVIGLVAYSNGFYEVANTMGGDLLRSEVIYTLPTAWSVNNLYEGIMLPQNPGLAPNNFNGSHQDSYCSETLGLAGPVTGRLKRIMQYNPYGFTPIMASNSENQIIGVSFSYEKREYSLIVFDEKLKILAQAVTSKQVLGTFGGGYFFLDNKENTIIAGDNKLKYFPTSYVKDTGSTYQLDPIWISDDIIAMIPEAGFNSLYSAMPLWDKDLPYHYWVLISGIYDTGKNKLVSNAWIAVVEIKPDPDILNGCNTRIVDAMEFPDQWNNNTFAVDEDGAYFLTNGFSAPGVCDDGYLVAVDFDKTKESIVLRWQYQYENSGILKTGMKNIGSGTTPSIMIDSDGNKIITVGDNAYPQMNVLLIDQKDGSLVTSIPVFSKMRSADEASFIAIDNSIIVENNFGHTIHYPDSQYVENEPGLALLMVDPYDENYSIKQVWEYSKQSILAMSVLCRESGVIFAHTADWNDYNSSIMGGMYYISAFDSYDGRLIWRIPLGIGLKYAHEYGGIYFDRNNNLYVGTNNYLISIQELH